MSQKSLINQDAESVSQVLTGDKRAPSSTPTRLSSHELWDEELAVPENLLAIEEEIAVTHRQIQMTFCVVGPAKLDIRPRGKQDIAKVGASV
jgi:hypothetical protein